MIQFHVSETEQSCSSPFGQREKAAIPRQEFCKWRSKTIILTDAPVSVASGQSPCLQVLPCFPSLAVSQGECVVSVMRCSVAPRRSKETDMYPEAWDKFLRRDRRHAEHWSRVVGV